MGCSRKIIYLSMIFLMLFFSCSPSHFEKLQKLSLTEEEYLDLEKFFRYFMLHETAIYTLAGSKPLTVMPLFYESVPEELLREREKEERIYFLLNRNREKDRAFYDSLSPIERREKAYLIEDRDFIYSIEDLWDKWEKIQSRFPINKRFLLVKKKWGSESWKEIFPNCKAAYDVFFVDILKSALVIQENYGLFRQTVGYDFDPLEVVFELENEHSDFWDKLRGEEGWRYAPLWGLLYGFGRENAFSYTWKGRNKKEPDRSEKERLWSASLQPHLSCKNRPAIAEKNAFTIAHFSIPIFKSFTDNDPVVAQYETERERIQQIYKGKDFVACTLELLAEPKNSK